MIRATTSDSMRMGFRHIVESLCLGLTVCGAALACGAPRQTLADDEGGGAEQPSDTAGPATLPNGNGSNMNAPGATNTPGSNTMGGSEVAMGPGTTPIVPNQQPPGAEAPGAQTPATMPPSPEGGEMGEADPVPPAGPVDASCVGITDPSFNLDVERPRGDPPPRNAALPALFVVGDSTVKNHNIQQEGWGDLLDRCFDGSRIQVINWGREGRSTRSFIEDGLWGKILAQMVAGDYVMVQFGHNDQSTLDTRGTITGTGEETQNVVSTTTMLNVEVHTYGYYLRQYVADTNARGAHLIFVTPVPRNYWTSETLTNNSVMAGYVGWMKEVAASAQLPLLDLNTALVDIYTAMGRTAVSAYFTSGDNTHTNVLGATTSAGVVLSGVNALAGSDLASFIAR